MNDSGRAVRKILAREHAPLGELLVVCDDFALPFGKLRFREGGGPGGHNGLRSVIDELENEQFSRLRVGIGSPDRGFADHVLAPFQPDERERLPALIDAAADAVEEWARHGTSKAANRFNPFELRPADETRVAPPGEVDGPPDTRACAGRRRAGGRSSTTRRKRDRRSPDDPREAGPRAADRRGGPRGRRGAARAASRTCPRSCRCSPARARSRASGSG